MRISDWSSDVCSSDLCRRPDGECAIDDPYRALFFDEFLPARGVIFCSPIYWYGVSAQIKAFFDRSFCYYAASYPGSQEALAAMAGKRPGLVLASEEACRPEGRRVGQEGVGTGRLRGPPDT